MKYGFRQDGQEEGLQRSVASRSVVFVMTTPSNLIQNVLWWTIVDDLVHVGLNLTRSLFDFAFVGATYTTSASTLLFPPDYRAICLQLGKNQNAKSRMKA